MKQIFLTILIVTMLSSILTANEERWTYEEKTFATTDNLTLHGWLGIPTAQKSKTLILLLPMMGHTHDSYDQTLVALGKQIDKNPKLSAYPYILSFDLRGHGKSTQIDSTEISFRNMEPEDFAKLPMDISSMTQSLLADSSLGLTIDSIIVIGASIGANSAVMVTQSLEKVSAVVLLSAGENYRGLRPAESIRKFENRLLLYAGTDDNYSAVSTKELGKLNKNCDVVIFDTEDHGTRIINNDPKAMTQMIKWILGEVTN